MSDGNTIFGLLSSSEKILCPRSVRNNILWRRAETLRLVSPAIQSQNIHPPTLGRQIHQFHLLINPHLRILGNYPPITRNSNQSLLAKGITRAISSLHIRLTNPLIPTLTQLTRHMKFLIIMQPANTDNAMSKIIRSVIPLFQTSLGRKELLRYQLSGVDVLFPYSDGAEFIDDSEEGTQSVEEEVIYGDIFNVRVELGDPVLEKAVLCRGIVGRSCGIETSSLAEDCSWSKRWVEGIR